MTNTNAVPLLPLNNPRGIEGFVFDLDGTIVDSEILMNRVSVRVFKELGWETTVEELNANFRGTSSQDFLAAIRKMSGLALEGNWEEPYQHLYVEEFKNLETVPGIDRVLEATRAFPRAIASNSDRERIIRSLDLVGLLHLFEGNIASATDVEHGKPDPAVYLLGASHIGVDPKKSIAIEDAYPGATAALAAGMHTFVYTKHQDLAEWHENPALHTFDSMFDLPDILQDFLNSTD